ncbi:MAG: hypothetical protein WA843_04055 [Candidatus Saccharimonadales bacterium]
MGKASELDRRTRRITQEEDDRNKGKVRPSLRLRPDVLDQAIEGSTAVQEVLNRLGHGGDDKVALHDPATGRTAVALSVERYLELVGSEMQERDVFTIGPNGQTHPPDGRLEATGAEQVDPQATWRTSDTPYYH